MSTSCSLNDIYYEGFLEKQRRVKAWSWKSYWFVLEGDQLSYYKDKQRELARGLIDLALAKTVRACAAPTKGFPFEIVTQSRSHTLSAKTAELRDKWVGLCERALLLSFRRSKSMHRPSCDSISDEDLPDSVLEELQKIPLSTSYSSGSEVVYTLTRSTPNTPVTQHPSRASRSRSNEENESLQSQDMQRSMFRSRNNRTYTKASTPTMAPTGKGPSPGNGAPGVPHTPPDKAVLHASRSNTSSSSLSTEDDEVFGTPPQRTVSGGGNLAKLRRNVQPWGRGSDASSQATSSQSSQCSGTITSPNDRPSISSIEDEDQEAFHYQSSAQLLKDGPLTSIDFTLSSVCPLPYPRLELVNKSIEDLRGFIARIRRGDEIFAKPHPNELGGRAMARLKDFLQDLDSSTSNGIGNS